MKNVIKLTIILFHFGLSNSSMAQDSELLWAQSIGGEGLDYLISTTIDNEGYIYSTGHYDNLVDFDASESQFELPESDNIFIQKLNTNGEFIWAKSLTQITSPNDGIESYGFDITTDSNNNLIVVGGFEGEVDFDSGDNNFIMNSQGSADMFVLKMNTEGDLLWAISIGGGEKDVGRLVTTDDDNNIYISGEFTGEVDFNPDPENEVLISPDSPSWGTYILKIDPNGNFLWVHGFSGGVTYPTDLLLDSNHNVLLSGTFSGPTDFDPGEDEVIYTPFGPSGNFDGYVLKLDTNGSFMWVQVLSTSRCRGLAIDHDDYIYNVGLFSGATDFDMSDDEYILTGNSDCYIQKLNPNGEIIWAKSIGGPSEDEGFNIIIDNYHNGQYQAETLLVTGLFGSTVDFDPSEEEFLLTASTGFLDQNAFIERLSTEGDFLWAKKIDDSYTANILNLLRVSDGSILTSGRFGQSNLDFDISDDIFLLSSNGWINSFIAKYNLICLSENFNTTLSTLPNIVSECEIDMLDTPYALNGCGVFFSGIPDISFPITENGEYLVTWTFENSDGQLLYQEQNINVTLIDTEVNSVENYLIASADSYSYQWVDCDNENALITGATTQIFYPETEGNYAVELSNSNGCTRVSECINFSTVDLIENQPNKEVNIYPNPSSDKIIITFPQLNNAISIRVLNFLGEKINQYYFKETNHIELFLEGSDSFYFIEIEDSFGTITRKKILKNN